MINGFSFNAVTVSNVNTLSTVVVVPPSRFVASSAPLNGTFVVSCTDNKGVTYTSKEIQYNAFAN